MSTHAQQNPAQTGPTASAMQGSVALFSPTWTGTTKDKSEIVRCRERDNREIIRLYRDGLHREGFELLARVYMARIQRDARRLVSSSTSGRFEYVNPEDLAQDALIRAHEALQRSKNRSEIQFLTAWISRVVRNQYLDARRKVKRKKPFRNAQIALDAVNIPGHRAIEIQDDAGDVFGIVARRQCVDDFVQRLTRMSFKKRRVMLLWIQGYKLREIADVTGFSLSCVAASINRTRELSEKHLRAQGWNSSLRDLPHSSFSNGYGEILLQYR